MEFLEVLELKRRPDQNKREENPNQWRDCQRAACARTDRRELESLSRHTARIILEKRRFRLHDIPLALREFLYHSLLAKHSARRHEEDHHDRRERSQTRETPSADLPNSSHRTRYFVRYSCSQFYAPILSHQTLIVTTTLHLFFSHTHAI